MAVRKKACILHVPEDACDVGAVQRRLEQEGYDVGICAITSAIAADLKADEEIALPLEVAECLGGADLVIILVSPSVLNSPGFGGVLAEAQNSGGRMVGVWGGCPTGTTVPQPLEDYGDSLVDVGSPRFPEAICDGDVWEGPTGEKIPAPEKKHQKCQ